MDPQYWSEIQLPFLLDLLSYAVMCLFYTFSLLLSSSTFPVFISLKAGAFASYFTMKLEGGGKLAHLHTVRSASLPAFTPRCSVGLAVTSNGPFLRPNSSLIPTTVPLQLPLFSLVSSVPPSHWLILISVWTYWTLCFHSKRNASICYGVSPLPWQHSFLGEVSVLAFSTSFTPINSSAPQTKFLFPSHKVTLVKVTNKLHPCFYSPHISLVTFSEAPLLVPSPPISLYIQHLLRVSSSALLFLTKQSEKALKNKSNVSPFLETLKWLLITLTMKSKPFTYNYKALHNLPPSRLLLHSTLTTDRLTLPWRS